jgi:hypothetical protein
MLNWRCSCRISEEIQHTMISAVSAEASHNAPGIPIALSAAQLLLLRKISYNFKTLL